MGFKDYILETLYITEAKVNVGGKEFPSKRDAAIAMAEAGKNAEFIMKAIGTTEAMAKHFVSKYGKKKAAADAVKIEPKKTKAMERKETLDAYKKGERYKPEPIEPVPLKDTKGVGAKEWMKNHGGDTSKQKDLKGIRKEMEALGGVIDKLETKERRYRKSGLFTMDDLRKVNDELAAAKKKMEILFKKEQDAIDSSKEVDTKTASQTDHDSKTYKGYTIKKVKTPVASTSPNAKMFGRSGIKHVSEYNVNGFKRNFESMADAKAAIDRAISKKK